MRRLLSPAFEASLFAVSALMTVWGQFGRVEAAVVPAQRGENALAAATAPLQVNFQDWQLTCSKITGQERYETCTISQQILDRRTHKQVVRMSFQPLEHQVRGQLLMPFGLDLGKGLTLTLSTDPAGQIYPYTTCRADGCVVPLDFDDEQMKNFLQAKQAHVSFQLLNGREISLPISLHGMAEAWAKAVNMTGGLERSTNIP